MVRDGLPTIRLWWQIDGNGGGVDSHSGRAELHLGGKRATQMYCKCFVKFKKK